MHKEILNRIDELIINREKDCMLDEDGLDNYELSKEGIKGIKHIESDKSYAFVDGGSAELIAGPTISLSIIRDAVVFFKNNKKIGSEKREFYCLVHAAKKDGRIMFNVETFPEQNFLAGLEFDSMDDSITGGRQRAAISKIGEAIRRFSELEFAKTALSKAEMIVLDGSLETNIVNEERFMRELIEEGAKLDKTICGLSKTSTRFTNSGTAVAVHLNNISKDVQGCWYITAGKSDKRQIYFAKFDKDAKHIFMLEFFETSKIDEGLSILAKNSKDLIFPGYPYGLVVVDELARISNSEKGYQMTCFETKSGKAWEKISSQLNCLNSHSILDTKG